MPIVIRPSCTLRREVSVNASKTEDTLTLYGAGTAGIQ